MPDHTNKFLFKLNICLSAIIVLLTGLLLIGCAQYDNEVGASLVDNDVTGVLKDTLIAVERSAMMTSGDVVKLNALNIPLGIQQGLTSDIVLRFTNFSALGDAVQELKSGEIRLFGDGFVDFDTSEAEDVLNWNAVVYRIDSEWDQNELTYSNSMDLIPLDTILFGTDEPFDTVSIPIGDSTLQKWIVDSLAYGIRIKPLTDATFLKNFASKKHGEVDKHPVLYIDAVLEKDDTTSIDSTVMIDLSFFDASDVSAFLTEDDASLPDDRFFIGAGYARGILCWADFDSLFGGREISLNLVELFLHTDEDSPDALGETEVFSFSEIDTTWFDDPDSAKIRSSSTKVFYVSEETSLLRLNITLSTQLWLYEPEENYGVVVRSINEFTGIGRRAFYDNSADSTLCPMFRVVFAEFNLP